MVAPLEPEVTRLVGLRIVHQLAVAVEQEHAGAGDRLFGEVVQHPSLEHDLSP